jgi:hypothetical protein
MNEIIIIVKESPEGGLKEGLLDFPFLWKEIHTTKLKQTCEMQFAKAKKLNLFLHHTKSAGYFFESGIF